MAQNTEIKTKPVCSECGSEDIYFDAVSAWNVDTQAYELTGTFDNSDCVACDGECSVKWIEYKSEVKKNVA